MQDDQLFKRAADDLESAAVILGADGYFSRAKDCLDTAQRIRERLATQPQKQEDGE